MKLFNSSIRKLFVSFLFFNSFAFCQSTTVSVTVTDPSAQVWANGTISYVFNPNPGVPGPYNWNGSLLPANYLIPTTVNLDGSGTATFTIPTSVGYIFPSGSFWTFTVCPNATILNCPVVNIPTVGSTQNISSTINAALVNIVINASNLPRAYADSEVKTIPQYGGTYYNTISKLPKFWDGSAWNFFTGSIVPNPSGSQNIIQPAGTSFNVNALNGEAYIGTVPGSYASVTAAITAGYVSMHLNPGFPLGGFSNSENANIEFTDPLHSHMGMVVPETYGAYGDNVHDDGPAIQKCMDEGTVFLECRILPASGVYLTNEQLVLKNGTQIRGNKWVASVATAIRSEYNGSAFVIAPGPAQSIKISDLQLILDPTLSSQVGFYINAQPITEGGSGGLWNSLFDHVDIVNCPLQCLWYDTPASAGTLVAQFVTHRHLTMEGPNQMHTAPLLQIDGQTGQMPFTDDSSVGGFAANDPNYPNALIKLTYCAGCTPSVNTAATNVRFDGCNVGNGLIGIEEQFTHDITFNGCWVENVSTPIKLSNAVNSIFTGNHIANSGIVGGVVVTEAGGNSNFSFRDNEILWNPTAPAALADCTAGSGSMVFDNNTADPALITKSCLTAQVNTAATLTVQNPVVFINGDSCATPISKIIGPALEYPVITMIATGGDFCTASGSGSNAISLANTGQYASPLRIFQGKAVTWVHSDLGGTNQWSVANLSGPFPLSAQVTITGQTTALTCQTGTVSVPGAQTTGIYSHVNASAAGTPDPDVWISQAYVSVAGTVTVQICTRVTDSSPGAITYNVSVN